MNKRHLMHGAFPRRTALALALGMSVSGLAFGQATTGSIFGQVPAGSADTVVVKSASGLTRQVAVDASGRYSVDSLPLGTYTVSIERAGQIVDSRSHVTMRVGSGTEVSFTPGGSANARDLSAVTVTANALPAIDVTGVDSRTVITSQQLAALPLARSAEAIALLAPGAVPGSSRFAGTNGNTLVSFGGSSVTENAYYINGMNVTDPLNGLGGISLPYGSIDQVEILSGGYGAAYGRSDGGVISEVGKRGTNEWHFGGQILYTPDWGRADPVNRVYPAKNAEAGQLRQYRNDDKGSAVVESAYVGGPLIKDKLFLFASVEASRSASQTTSAKSSAATVDRYEYRDPKWYGKLDWNINDSNILELTGASTKHAYSGNTYAYDYGTRKRGDFISADTHTKNAASMWIAKYTGYITDDLTISAQYGKQVTDMYTQLPDSFDPTLIAVLGGSAQDPLLNGGVSGGITNNQTITDVVDNSAHQLRGANYRIDLTYRLGDHTITAGIDNQRTQDLNDGKKIATNEDFMWEYQDQSTAPNSEISEGGVSAPGGRGYYVDKYRRSTSASVRVEQRAQYIEDTWQVTDRWLVKLGLRNDQFTNFNSDGVPYLRQTKPQWAPRLGFSWDVNGDSSFRVYGNAGRYYLALPTSVALRGASGSLFTREYYNYTGIDPKTGYPTGLTPINTVSGPGVPYSENLEYGQSPDPKTVTVKSLTAQYQDEYIAGFDKKFNDNWVYGAKLTYRSLKNQIDDTATPELLKAKAIAAGLDPSDLRGSYFFNPGRAATFVVPDGKGGYGEVRLSNAELGFDHAKRNYYGLNLYLEHPFDGKWYGKVSYTFSRSYGNTEGQVKSDTGQDDIAATQDWDYPSLMDLANGRMANDRTHQLKIYGGYQVTPEWLVAGNVLVTSGGPTDCMGLYGPQQTTPAYGGPYYHWCGGKPVPAGTAGDTPWTKLVSLNVEYRPRFADHKLAFNVDVFNVFNEQKPTVLYPYYLSNYRLVQASQAPRYVRFGVTYDF